MLHEKVVKVEAILATFVLPDGLHYGRSEIDPTEAGERVDAVDFHFEADDGRQEMFRIDGADFIECQGTPERLAMYVGNNVRMLAERLGLLWPPQGDAPLGAPALVPIEELNRWRAELEVRQPVDSFIAAVERMNAPGVMCSEQLFRKPKAKFLLEALALVEFLKLVRPDEVCLPPARDQHPDAFIWRGAEKIKVEITEALGERKRGKDYGPDSADVEVVTMEEIEELRRQLPQTIEAVIKNKDETGANRSALLLVRVGMWVPFDLPEDVEAQIRETKERWRAKFGDLFIVHKTKVY
jgi:hypothetical protein